MNDYIKHHCCNKYSSFKHKDKINVKQTLDLEVFSS